MNNLIQFYWRSPKLFARHARIGLALLLRPGGAPRIRAALAHQKARMGAAGFDVDKALLAIRDQQTRRPATWIQTLAPYAMDRAGIADLRMSPAQRLRKVRAAIMTEYALLDAEYYALHAPGVGDVLAHYLDHGMAEGRWPNPFFDPRAYIRANSDISAGGIDPVIHYALFGWREGRAGGVHFDPVHYIAQQTAPLPHDEMAPFVHFLNVGRSAGLSPAGPTAPIEAPGPMPPRGTVVIVVHETEVGGAPALARSFGQWLKDHTRFDVRFVAMRGGNLAHAFSDIAPTLIVSDLPAGKRAAAVAEFAGEDVRVVLLNSVASGDFLRLWGSRAPVVSHIHELPKILKNYRAELDLILERSALVLGGSQIVTDSLRDDFGADPARLDTQYAFVPPVNPGMAALAKDKFAARRALGLEPSQRIVSGCGILHWRKAPDKFIEVAKRVLAIHPDVLFRWIGGGPDHQLCERMVRDAGLTGRIEFTGYVPDVLPHLAAADIFLLPSEEDPFPLVCLNAAQMLNPVACFYEAGGAPELFADGGGRALPFGDVEAMAEAVRAWLDDPERLAADATEGQRRVERGFTLRSGGPALLAHLRKTAGLRPEVSVIVPNYNYERYLPERLRTIADQSFQDFEVILLDDQSSDGSVGVLRDWAGTRPGTRLEVNEVNSGSPFAQWLKGMALARGELIWIAEADDSARPEMLGRLVRAMCDRNVMLAYAKSVPIGADGTVLGDYGPIYLDRINAGRWNGNYVVTDHEEVNSGLGIANCIPNASSVLFRAFEPEPEFASALLDMRMCGDWLFYLRAIRGGLVAFNAAPDNLHRRHDSTVTSATEGSLRYFDELATVRKFVRNTYKIEPAVQSRISDFMRDEIARFGVTEPDQIAGIEASVNGPSSRPPAVLVAVSDLGAGGGQLFAIRLTAALAARGSRAVLVDCATYPVHARMVDMIHPRIPLFTVRTSLDLSELLQRFDIDVVQTSLWWADRFVANSAEHLGDRVWVSSMHGCHETLIDNPDIDRTAPEIFEQMLDRVDAWVVTAQKNRELFVRVRPPRVERQIDNGVDARLGTPIPRWALGLRDDALVLVLASRAIPDKGWAAALEITKRLNAAGRPTDLLLIGDGPEAERLKSRIPKHVHLIGQVSNLADYLATADIGLIPSSFIGESMPLVMLDMMAQGCPVIATDRGEIPRVLGAGSDTPAGVVVPLRRGAVDVEGFVAAINRLAENDYRAKLGEFARDRFAAGFTVEQMAEAYDGLYRELLAVSDKVEPRS